MRKLTLSLAFVLTIALPASSEESHTTDSLETVKENLKAEKAILVDVREQSEWEEGHLKAAELVPLSEMIKGKLEQFAQDWKKDIIIYAHCAKGGRALICAEYFKAHGFDIRPLKPGYKDLLKAGFEKAK